jgi:thiol-disulfide isomerase/thioredoxin
MRHRARGSGCHRRSCPDSAGARQAVSPYCGEHMDALTAALILASLVAIATGLGVAVRYREGRLRRVFSRVRLQATHFGANVEFGSRATLLQFSTEYCTKCPATRAYLQRVAAEHDGVRHVDVDLTNRADLANEFNVLQTPTTLVLDEHGVIAARIGGSPRPEALTTALTIALRRDHDNYAI